MHHYCLPLRMKKSIDPIVNLCLQLVLKHYFILILPPFSPTNYNYAAQIHPMHRLLLNIAYQKYSLLSLESVPESSAFHKMNPLLIPLCFFSFLPRSPTNPILRNHSYYLSIKLNPAERSKGCCFRKSLLSHYHSHPSLQYFKNCLIIQLDFQGLLLTIHYLYFDFLFPVLLFEILHFH